MRRVVALVLVAAACARLLVETACLPGPEVSTAVPVFTTSPLYASWTVDPSRNRAFFNLNLSDPRLLYLASEIGGGLIRFGGTGADMLQYAPSGGDSACGPLPPPAPFPFPSYECLNSTQLDSLLELVAAARAPLIFQLNLLWPVGRRRLHGTQQTRSSYLSASATPHLAA